MQMNTLLKENRLEDVVDKRCRDADMEAVEAILEIAARCTDASPDYRPTMNQVAQMLEQEVMSPCPSDFYESHSDYSWMTWSIHLSQEYVFIQGSCIYDVLNKSFVICLPLYLGPVNHFHANFYLLSFLPSLEPSERCFSINIFIKYFSLTTDSIIMPPSYQEV